VSSRKAASTHPSRGSKPLMALSEAMRLNKSRSLLSATQSKRRLISRNIRLPRSTDTPIQRLNTTLTKVYNQQYEHAALDLIPFAKQLTFLCQDPSLEKAPVVALLATSWSYTKAFDKSPTTLKPNVKDAPASPSCNELTGMINPLSIPLHGLLQIL
jgi:hypothetical protein